MLYLVPGSALVDKRGTSFLRHALRALRHGLMDHFGAVTDHGQTSTLSRERFELLRRVRGLPEPGPSTVIDI